MKSTLRWGHNGRDSVSNHQPHHCLLNRLFSRRSKKTSKLRVTGLCVGKSPGTGEFPAQMASNAENVSIWWRHHEYSGTLSWKYGSWRHCLCEHLVRGTSVEYIAIGSVAYYGWEWIMIKKIRLYIWQARHIFLWATNNDIISQNVNTHHTIGTSDCIRTNTNWCYTM